MALAIGGQAQQVLGNLSALGPRKLAGLGIIGLLVVALVGLGSYFLSRPDMDTLYSGLDRTDVTRIGAALTEAGIPFDVNAKGDAILTPFSQTAPARMLLAEKGLPRSENAGYELFDNIGSIGLTSFMQEITKVRALEGELARTIQTLSNVRAARVHIVLGDEGSYRRERQKPSASVVIRTEAPEDFGSAQAIRNLVASAIPSMTPEEVTILNTDGTLLASGDDSAASTAPTKLFGIERIVSKSVEDSIRRTLAPYLGVGNFQTSVVARLNTDKKQISERIFDPDGRVERSTRTIKESGQTQNSSTQNSVGVQQDIQAANPAPTSNGGETSKEANDRREELTNYEINEKTVQTTSDGYTVERLSIAVVLNRQRIKDSLGANAGDAEIDKRIGEIQSLVASASGLNEERGDQLKVTAVDFLANDASLEPVPGPGLGEMFMRQSGTLINALTVLAVAVMLIWFGLKPAIRAIAATPAAASEEGGLGGLDLSDDGLPGALQLPGGFDFGAAQGSDDTPQLGGMQPAFLSNFDEPSRDTAQSRLENLLDLDEAQAANVLKQWIHQKEAA
ncbi:flagellar basal-body MS-ring/collar protein FliF [Aurantimonas sp. VKM B-3413]|uniref:flagellar basal-body MS-ring/collar protein FliF n=1 Tax=Aurantimonas sp. VKM B-3413 TaxID=2779401 RepID=UPI001E30EFDB|nr:flagellar basal-body MS-ring/collar protein FliF [Aurantimonas sp. VKM B-3413]MCB8838140.1 flagellar M-ring protein FliF [Aurantimonas sp. VKM B-3413]